MSAAQIEIAEHLVWVRRVFYAGELGYKIYGPREHMRAIYDALWASGQAHGIADYGSFALNSLA